MSSDPRFDSHTARSGECIVYVGSRDRQGYGRLLRKALSTAPILAHRYAWMLVNGPIPAGSVVMHTCDNPPCVNAAHLVLGTQADNIRDRDRKGRHRPGRLNGEAHPAARLSAADVRELRALHRAGIRPKALIPLFPQVSRHTVLSVLYRQNWKAVA